MEDRELVNSGALEVRSLGGQEPWGSGALEDREPWR